MLSRLSRTALRSRTTLRAMTASVHTTPAAPAPSATAPKAAQAAAVEHTHGTHNPEKLPVSGPTPGAEQLSVTHAKDRKFVRGMRSFFEYADLDLYKATKGGAVAHLIRGVPGLNAQGIAHLHPEITFQFVYVLKGWVVFEYEDANGGIVRHRLEAGSTVYQPPQIRHREIEHSDDVEMLEIVMPGDFGSQEVEKL